DRRILQLGRVESCIRACVELAIGVCGLLARATRGSWSLAFAWRDGRGVPPPGGERAEGGFGFRQYAAFLRAEPRLLCDQVGDRHLMLETTDRRSLHSPPSNMVERVQGRRLVCAAERGTPGDWFDPGNAPC